MSFGSSKPSSSDLAAMVPSKKKIFKAGIKKEKELAKRPGFLSTILSRDLTGTKTLLGSE